MGKKINQDSQDSQDKIVDETLDGIGIKITEDDMKNMLESIASNRIVKHTENTEKCTICQEDKYFGRIYSIDGNLVDSVVGAKNKKELKEIMRLPEHAGNTMLIFEGVSAIITSSHKIKEVKIPKKK